MEGKKMNGKQRKKRSISLFVLLFTLLSSLIFFMPTGLTNDQITLSFYPDSYLNNSAPYQPTAPYPSDGATNINFSLTLKVNVSDPDNDPMNVYFYYALDDSFIGMDTVPNGSTATCSWNGLASSTKYRWYAIARDPVCENVSPIWTFTTQSSYGGRGSTSPANKKPIADITGPDTGYVNEYINFSAQYSYDPDGEITGYRWDFNNDGLFDTDWTEDTLATYTYFIPGNYSVKLQVTDDDDATSTDLYVITILQGQQLPVAQANGPYVGLVYENITFSGGGSYDPDGTIVNYTWDFGDGTIGYGVESIRSYTISGLYNITLSVTDRDNLTSNNTTTAQITPYAPEEGKLPLLFLIITTVIVTISIVPFIRRHYEINLMIKQLDKLKKTQHAKKKRANKFKSIGRTNKKRAGVYYNIKSKNALQKIKRKKKK